MEATSDHRERILVQWRELLFAVRRSRRYHMHREQFLATFHFAFTVATMFSGSAALATILAKSAMGPWFAAATAIFGAVELAGQSFVRALNHRELTQRFTRLERAMQVSESEINARLLRKLERRRLKIEIDEPPPLQIVNLMCHNEEVLAGGHDPKHYREVRWYQRVLAPVLDFRFHTAQKPSPGA